jgi:hypothetical protein
MALAQKSFLGQRPAAFAPAKGARVQRGSLQV